jgi:DNA-binding transcriptional ArsR family regulator
MPTPEDMKARAGEAAGFLKNLANPNRLMILCLLSQGELCVSDIQSHLDISQTALSQHLARLREEGIVTFRRDHRTLYYSILNPHVTKIVAALYDIYCPKKD